jgi:cell division GTPase FtsZ
MDEIGEITEHVQEEAGYGTDLIWGNCKDESLGEKIMITLIATGFREGGTKSKELKPEKVKVSLENERTHTSLKMIIQYLILKRHMRKMWWILIRMMSKRPLTCSV